MITELSTFVTAVTGDLTEGWLIADSDDPALAGLEDNQAAWYSPEGHIYVVTLGTTAVLLQRFEPDGDCVHRMAIPWPHATPKLVVALFTFRGEV